MKIIYRLLYIGRPNLTNPAIAVLTNITKFHNGLLTNDLFSTFDFTMAVIPKLLGLKEDVKVKEDLRIDMRSKFIKFYLSFISNSSVIVRRDLIAQKKVISSWFKFIDYDNANTVALMVSVLEKSVLREPSFLKTTKINLFNDWTIVNMARLLDRTDKPSGKDVDIGTIVFNFLKLLTCDSTYGIKFADRQWYLPSATQDDSEDGTKVNNHVLLTLLKSMKPWEHIQRQDLVLSILEHSPELVTYYFKQEYPVSLDPKLSVFWISNILFFSRAIQLPIPNELLTSSSLQPPKTDVIIEHILPQPLTKQALSKSLIHPTLFIKYNAFQILIFAFNKLDAVIQVYKANGWADSCYLLLEEIVNRLPEIRTLLNAITTIENLDDHKLLKTIFIKTIALYSQLLPELLVREKITLPANLTSSMEKAELDSLELVDLKNVLEVQAKLGGIGKWWIKSNELPYSLFTTLLKLSVQLDDKLFTKQITTLVEYLSKPTMLFRESTVVSPISVLVHSLKVAAKSMSTEELEKLWKLFDNSVRIAATLPYKHIDDLSAIQKQLKCDQVDVSPFLSIVIKQYAYVDKSSPYENVEKWLKKYIRDSIVSGENGLIISELAKVAELPFHSQIDTLNNDDFKTIQKIWSSNSSAVESYVGESVFNSSVSDLASFDNVESLSPLDLLFIRYRLSHETDASVIHSLTVLLENLPVSIRPQLLKKEFWNPLVLSSNIPLLLEFINVLFNSFTLEEIKTSVSFNQISDCLKNIVSANSLAVKDKASLLQHSVWSYDKEFLTAQLDSFLSLSETYEISNVFEQYFIFSASEIISLDKLKSIITYAVRSPSVRPVLKFVKNYIDNAPAEFVVSSSFFETIKDLFSDRTFASSHVLTSLIKRLPALDTSVIEKFVTNSWVDDFTFLTIIKEFLDEQDLTEENLIALKGLISSATSVVVKTLQSAFTSDAPEAVKAAISLADKLLDLRSCEGVENLEKTVVEFVSQSKGSEAIYPETVFLVGKLYSFNTDEKSTAIASIRTWSQRCIIWLNKRLAEDPFITEKAQTLIDSLTTIVNKYKLNLWVVVPTDSLNTLLEIASNKYLHFMSILKLIGSLVLPTRLPGKQIEFTKLLQIILQHEKTPLLMELDKSSTTAEGSGLILAYIIHTLFNVDVTKHSNKTVQDKILTFCMGTQRPQDLLLIDVLRKIESRTSVSFANSVYSWVFSATAADMFEQQRNTNHRKGLGENYNEFLLDDSPTNKLTALFQHEKEGFLVTIDAYLIQNTIRNFDTTTPFFPYLDALAPAKNKAALSFDEKFALLNGYAKLLRSEYTYDLEFLMLLVASSNLVKEQKVSDLKLFVETGSLGVVLCSMSYPESITSGVSEDATKVTAQNSLARMARTLLEAAAAALADSTYREEDILTIFFSKLLYFFNEGNQLSSSIAVFLASVLDIIINPGHFLYNRVITEFLLTGPSIKPKDLPMFVPLITTSKTDESDPQGKDLVWLAETLVSGLVNLEDVKLYLRAGVFEWLFNITSTVPLVSAATAGTAASASSEKNFAKLQNSFYVSNHRRLHELARQLVARAQEISHGTTTLLIRSGLLAWVQTEYDCQQNVEHGDSNDAVVVKKLGLRTVLTADNAKLREWTNSEDLRTPLLGLD